MSVGLLCPTIYANIHVVPGRTSHACQFRWRRLVSGTLKYYQGHRRPPVVTTTSSSFASEMAASGASHTSSAPATPSGARYPAPVSPATSPQNSHYAYDRALYQHRSSFSSGSFALPSPASSPPQQNVGSPTIVPGTPCPASVSQPSIVHSGNYGPYGQNPPYFPPGEDGEDDEDNWTAEEDALLMDRKLCFEEVNVLLSRRREPEIWRRMGRLRWGRGRSESNASSENELGSFSGVESRGIVKLPPVPAGRVLRSHSIQR